MTPELKALLLMYIIAITLTSILATIYDKIAAKRNPKNRVKESNLLMLGAVGGALPMMLTMMLIQHKTRKPKFMLGLPAMIFFHVALFTYLSLQL